MSRSCSFWEHARVQPVYNGAKCVRETGAEITYLWLGAVFVPITPVVLCISQNAIIVKREEIEEEEEILLNLKINKQTLT